MDMFGEPGEFDNVDQILLYLGLATRVGFVPALLIVGARRLWRKHTSA